MKITMVQNKVEDIMNALFPMAEGIATATKAVKNQDSFSGKGAGDETKKSQKPLEEKKGVGVRKRIDFHEGNAEETKFKDIHPQTALSSVRNEKHNRSTTTVSGDIMRPLVKAGGDERQRSGVHRHQAPSASTKPISITKSQSAKHLEQQFQSPHKSAGRKASGSFVAHRQSPPNYAGAKFSDSPSPKVIPPPPVHWVLGNPPMVDTTHKSSHAYARQESQQVKVFA